jgi:hypothetical protein
MCCLQSGLCVVLEDRAASTLAETALCLRKNKAWVVEAEERYADYRRKYHK